MSVVERIRDALSGETNRAQPSPNEQSDQSRQSEQTGRSERSERPETRLYRCDPCGTTYVSDELDACSQCNEPVERIPTERDLGLV